MATTVVADKYYPGRRWSMFEDPVEALTTAGFPRPFAKDAVKRAGKDGAAFVAYGKQSGVRLVRVGEGSWDRYYVRFDQLFDSEEHARHEAVRMSVRPGVSSLAKSFLWTGEPLKRSDRP